MLASRKHIKNFNVGIILFLIFVLPPMVYFYTTRGYNTFSKLEIVGKEGHKIPEFSFINQHNEIIVNDSMVGNIYIANFFFSSCPTICPVATKNMAYVQNKLKVYPNIRFLSHTVDPKNDTPEKMLHYVEELRSKNVKIDLSNWDFLTGEKTHLYDIARLYLLANSLISSILQVLPFNCVGIIATVLSLISLAAEVKSIIKSFPQSTGTGTPPAKCIAEAVAIIV